MKVKRYVVFAYDRVYPSGGWSDYQGSFDTLPEADERARELMAKSYTRRINSQVLDLETGEQIE